MRVKNNLKSKTYDMNRQFTEVPTDTCIVIFLNSEQTEFGFLLMLKL